MKTVFASPLILLVVTLTLSGCLGFAVEYPKECPNESLPDYSSKSDYMNKRGKPTKITVASVHDETWIYEQSLWCGIVPFWLIPVPLILPVCDGYDRVDFRDGEVIGLHTRHEALTGGLLSFLPYLYPAPISLDTPNCKHPVLTRLHEPLLTGKTVFLNVVTGNPDDQHDQDYETFTLALRDRLTQDLVELGIFTEIVPANGGAEYDMVVSLVSVKLSHRWFRKGYTDIFAKAEVRITRRGTNQEVGRFEVEKGAHSKRIGSIESIDLVYGSSNNDDMTVSDNPQVTEVVSQLAYDISNNLVP